MRVTGLDHIVVNVKNVDEAIDFYGGVLGMEVLRDGPSFFIRAPEGNRIEIKCYKG